MKGTSETRPQQVTYLLRSPLIAQENRQDRRGAGGTNAGAFSATQCEKQPPGVESVGCGRPSPGAVVRDGGSSG